MEGVAAGARGHHIGRDASTGFAPASSPTTLLTPWLYLGCISAAASELQACSSSTTSSAAPLAAALGQSFHRCAQRRGRPRRYVG